jgi:4-alpha-glucanotransferase
MFAFGDDFPDGSYLPYNYSKNSIVYTGTHDNNTVKGWYLNEANQENKKRVSLYTDKEINESNICWELVRLGMMSSAKYAVFPVQDVLCLGQEARFNLPSTTRHNWIWRVNKKMLSQDIANKLADLVYISGRL